MLPTTVERVRKNTAEEINRQIRDDMERRVACLAKTGPEVISRQLVALDQEWDIERTLEANAATLAAVGSGLSLFVDRRFAVIPFVVGSFLLQHALQGWCPPIPIFRRYGFRTQSEIEAERYPLKAIRGDFRGVDASADSGRHINAAAAFQAVDA